MLRSLLTSIFILILTGNSFALSEIRTIPTQPGVTMDFLIMTPEQPLQRDALIFFPGGNGAGPFKLSEDGLVSGWRFLVRSADSLVRDGLSVVTVYPPSYHPTGMSTCFQNLLLCKGGLREI